VVSDSFYLAKALFFSISLLPRLKSRGKSTFSFNLTNKLYATLADLPRAEEAV